MKKKFLSAILGLIIAGLIFGLNFWLIFPWFSGEGPVNLGSIEVSYVSMARFLRDFSPHLSYAPYWYFGFPFHLFYTPFLPFLTMILNRTAAIHLWQAYRIITGLSFALAPVSLFFFVWSLTKKIISGILAALGYTFLPSLFYFILPSGEVAKDVISQGFWDPRRLVILARWGEGPHTLSLVFLPLAGLFYLKALDTRGRWSIFLAALFIGLTALTNAVGLYALILLILAIFFSELVKRPKKFTEILGVSALTAVFSFGLIAFWYNFSFIGTFFGESGGVLRNYLNLFPWGDVLLLAGGVGLYYFFQKIIRNREVIISSVWFIILFLIVYIYYVSAPPEFSEQRIELAPQALRLMTEVDMALAVFGAVLMAGLISFLEKRGRIFGILGNLGSLGVIGVIGVIGVTYLPAGQEAVSGVVDLAGTGEYEIAHWLKNHVDSRKGERVYLAGNYGFYLNYFTDIWQLRGGLFQAMTHPWPEHIFYQVNHGKDPAMTLAWLKAANIKYLVGNAQASRELYKDFETLEKFKDFPVVYDEKKGDIIYRVPLGSLATEPAKVVDLSVMEGLVSPRKADDKKPLLAYVDWLDKSSPASFQMVNHDRYRIKAKVGQGQGVLVQMTYDSGFKASLGESRRASLAARFAESRRESRRAQSGQGKWQIKKDPLGFMVLVPPTVSVSAKEDEEEITLSHGKTWEIWLGYLITLGTLGGVGYWGMRKRGQGESPRRWF